MKYAFLALAAFSAGCGSQPQKPYRSLSEVGVASRSASAYIEQQVLKKEWPHNWRVVHTQGEPDPDHVGRVWVKTIADPAEKQHLGKRIAFVDCTVDLAQSPQEKDRIFNCTSSFTRSR